MDAAAIEANRQRSARFWQRMQMLVGVIPFRVIGVMDLLQLSGSSALEADEEDWVTSLTTWLQDDGEEIFAEACRRGLVTADQKFDIFGRHANDLRQFKLTPPERRSMISIAGMVRNHGILHFIRETAEEPQAPPTRRSTVPANDPLVPGEVKASLIKRLSAYFKNRVEFNIRPQAFDNLPMSIEWQTGENMRVQAKCVQCTKTIGCTKTGAKWAISNYTQHVHRKHKALAQASGTNSRVTRSQTRRDRADGEDDEYETIGVEVLNGGDAGDDSDTVVSPDTAAVTATEQPRDDSAGDTGEGQAEVVLMANPVRDGNARRVVSTCRIDLSPAVDPREGCSQNNPGN